MKRSPSRRERSPEGPIRAAHPAERHQAKERLDIALVSRGLAPTREKAARLIMAGHVEVNGQRADKAGALVDATAPVAVAAQQKFVSRGGEKLAPVLDAFGVLPRGRICVDVGASTGGFTQCLLERGAARVYAVDAGHGQLDAGLRADGRVVVMEKTNARHLVAALFPDAPDLATVDVSFISLEKVLPAVFRVLAPAGEALALVKPQFEVGKGQVGKGGRRARSRTPPRRDEPGGALRRAPRLARAGRGGLAAQRSQGQSRVLPPPLQDGSHAPRSGRADCPRRGRGAGMRKHPEVLLDGALLDAHRGYVGTIPPWGEVRTGGEAPRRVQ